MYSVKVITLVLLCILHGICGDPTSPGPSDLTIKSSEPDVNLTTIPQLQEEASEIVKVVLKNETTSTTNPPLPNSNAVQQEHNNSMAIFFVLCVIALGKISVFHSNRTSGR